MAADEALDNQATNQAQDDGADSPETESVLCRSVPDFYSSVSRFWIREFYQEFLDGRRITPTELLHLPHLQQELSTYHLRLTVIQRAANVQTRAKGPIARRRFEELVQLEEQVLKFTAQRGRTGEPPVLDTRAFGAAVKKLYGANPGFEGRFDIDALLAHNLSPLKSLSAKVDRLLALSQGEVPAETFAVIDQVLGEILASPAAVTELFGWVKDYRALLELLADLWEGTVVTPPNMPPLVQRLNRLMADWTLEAARRGIEVTLHRLLLRDDRLSPVSDLDLLGTAGLLEELIATGSLAAKLKSQGSFIGGKKTAKLLDLRISHLLSEEKLEDLLRGKSFYGKLTDLFNLDQAVIGEYSQQIVSSYLQRLLDHREFAARMLDSSKTVRSRLRSIADVQQRMGKSTLPAAHKAIYVRMLDEIQHTYVRTGQIFGKFGKDKQPSADEVLELAGLVGDGSLTEDKVATWARELLRHHVRTSGFLKGFIASLRNAPDRAQRVAAAQERLQAAGMAMFDLSAMRVLLAEDEDSARSYIEMILRDLGVENVVLARDGRQAMELFSGHEDDFDLIICDWKMPHLSGLGFLKQVRSVRSNLPFLMVTALATLIAVEEAMAHDVTAYISKPFPPEQLEEKVLILVNRQCGG